ncbi:MAG TPA: lysylphosphatidylglycerol synthase transmembrane domain-containing protein [Blastocatellia bacterium]|nr:lysylphosphatidylglycerol synthase transmembrane domain-containing protein [Blastocatellia bacterium]
MSTDHVGESVGVSEPNGVRGTARSSGRSASALRRAVQVVLGLGALALVLSRSDPAGLAAALKATRAAYLPIAILASLTVTWLMAFRWKLILEVRGKKLRTLKLFAYYLIGIFFSNCVPGGSVSLDVARLIYVDRDIRDKAFVTSTLVFERVVGLFAVLITGLAATIAARSYLPDGNGVYVVEAILGAGLVLAVLLMSERVSTRISAAVARASASARNKRGGLFARLRLARVTSAMIRFLDATAQMKRYHGMVASTVALSFVIRIVWSLGCYVVAVAMHLPVELPLIFAFIAIYDLIRMLPITISGLGIREWALVALFARVGVGREQALMFSFLAVSPILLNAIAGGLIYISTAGRIKSRQQAEVGRQQAESSRQQAAGGKK